MKRYWTGSRGLSIWLLGLWLAVVGSPGGLAQEPSSRERGGDTDTPRNETNLFDRERGVSRSQRRIGELINVFSTSEVDANERASSAVTVWGNARVEGEVGGECITVFGNATVDGRVGGECITVFGDFELNGEVQGELVVVMGNARFGPKAVVHGECIVVGGKLVADPGATFYRAKREFAGFLPPLGAWFKYGLVFGRPLVPSLGWVWVIFLLHVIVYLLVAVLLPKPVEACEQALRTQPLVSFGVGLLGLFLFWPAVTLVAATGVGVLVIPFLLVATLGGIILGKTAAVQWMGRSALRAGGVDVEKLALAGFLVGTAIVTILYMMPVLGFVTWGLLLPLGFGAALMALIDLIRQHRAKRPPAPPVPVPVSSLAPSSALSSPAANLASSPATGVTPLEGLGLSAAATEPFSGPVAGDATTPSAAPGVSASPIGVLATPSALGLAGAEMTALPRAGFWIRLAATLLDLILLGWFLQFVDGYFPLVWIAYHVGMWTWKGTTIGGIVCGLKVVREDGRPLDFTVALVRSLAAVFSFVALGIGFFWAGWSPERQSWHDKIAGTVIVKVPKGTPLI